MQTILPRSFLTRLESEQELFSELERELVNPAYVKDHLRLKELTTKHSQMKPRIQQINEYLKLYRQWNEAKELATEEMDKDLQAVAAEEVELLQEELQNKKKQVELLLIPPNPNEGRNIFIEIRAGTGGEEAALFVSDLLRMYLRLAERHAFKAEIVSSIATELGGYKEIVLSLRGSRVYTLLHSEGGAHRVQRVPYTENNGRVHTSAVTVAVSPEREENEIEINESDLQIDTFRASGAGGQHVNKTESAIRLTHLPSGLVISCQDERSQHKNKARAMRILRTKLATIQEEEAHAQENLLKREQIKSGDRSERIRTYNFPQGRITDHRIAYTSYNLEAFMDGEMDELLEALVEAEKEKQLESIQT